jgi:hypothetical protein
MHTAFHLRSTNTRPFSPFLVCLPQIQRQVRMYLAKCVYDRLLYEKQKDTLVRRLTKEAVFATRFEPCCLCCKVGRHLN